MAIDLLQFKLIQKSSAKGSCLSAGYPDLLVKMSDIAHGLKPRADTAQAQHMHSWPHEMADSRDVFAIMGLSLRVIDRAKLQGCEDVVDLNVPQDLGEYDLVIDPGTSEHVFNVPQSLVNLAQAVKVGGVISQALPVSMHNHGYWNVTLAGLNDFYEQNGFAIEDMLIRHDHGTWTPKPDERTRRMMGVPENSVAVVTARRLTKEVFKWPQQK